MATSESLSTAQNLPSYIIFEILKHFSAPLFLDRYDPHGRFPWYLAHICSSWRIEFLTMRRHFWNEIRLSISHCDTEMEKRHQRVIEVLTMFLERNRGDLFSFKLTVSYGTASRCPYLFTIFNLLVSESPRWQRVTLSIDVDDLPGLQRVKGRLEHLESLKLFCTEFGYTFPRDFTDLFMTAPRFTRLSLFNLSTWNFNWSIMTLIYIHRIRQTEVARLPSILSQAVRLETLMIYLEDKTLPSIPSIVLPSLLSLITDTFSLLHAITTPSLKNLHIYSGSVNSYDAGLVGTFFGRSRCHLQGLKLLSVNGAMVIEILSHTPDIRTLYLCNVLDSVAKVFRWLNGIHQVEAPKLTSLQSLAVHGCNLLRWNQIFDFISQRKTPVEFVVEKLQELDIRSSEMSSALKERLRKECILHDIRYARVEIQWEDVHDCSQDSHV